MRHRSDWLRDTADSETSALVLLVLAKPVVLAASLALFFLTEQIAITTVAVNLGTCLMPIT
jgi:hypothetical protein